tara:strand:- start:1573 stop:2313 length:741 start_codon:yes stop_codon:yes gene_type:complete
MRVLVACEYSGTVRDAFKLKGHEAWSCDLLPTDRPGLHYQGDVLNVLEGWNPVMYTNDCDPDGDGICNITQDDVSECKCYGPTQDDDVEYKEINGELFCRPKENPSWDLMIAHPPCTYLASSGLHWNKRIPGRDQLTLESLKFVTLLFNAPIPKIVLENPIGRINTAIRKPDQIIQPWMFGEDASKSTCLWLKGVPKLEPTDIIKKDRYANQTPSGQNNLGPSKDRWKIRSTTYQGIAEAMATQWG